MNTMMKFGDFNAEVKNVKIYKEFSTDSCAFTCNLYVNGKNVAECLDNGRGGELNVTVVEKNKELYNKFVKYIESQKVEDYDFNSNIDIAVEDMINQYEYEREIKRKMTYNLVFEKTNKSDCFSIAITPKTNLAKVVTIPNGKKCIKNLIEKYTTGKYASYKCINTNIDVNGIMK